MEQMNKIKRACYFLFGTVIAIGCNPPVKQFPVIGPEMISESGDTLIHTIGGFQFIDQDGAPFTHTVVEGKMYVADFFFTTCPDICPMMSKALLRVEKETSGMEDFLILSHTLDPEFDTPEELLKYIEDIGAEAKRWHFLTTDNEDYVYQLMMDRYLLSGSPTGAINGGIFHTGKLVLVDQLGRIRGYYEGTDPLDVQRLIEDIPVLQEQMKKELSNG